MGALGRLADILSCLHCCLFVFRTACGASCQFCSLDVARYAFKNKKDNMLNNQTIPVQALTTDLGLSVVKRGYTSKESLLEVIESMPYKFKTKL